MQIRLNTLADLIDRAAVKYGKAEAIVYNDKRMNYQQMHSLSESLAKGFLKLGISKGDKVAIWMPNCPEWEICEFAIFKVGGIMVPLNTRFKIDEMDYILNQSDATTLIMVDEFLGIDFMDMLSRMIPQHKHVPKGNVLTSKFPYLKNIICKSDKTYQGIFGFQEILDSGRTLEDRVLAERQGMITGEDVASIPYTSGTTGFPKGVMTTHYQILKQISDSSERLTIREGDRFCTTTPFSYNFGNYFGPYMAIMFGGCVVALDSFDPEKVLEAIEREKCTNILGTPTIYIELLKHSSFQKHNLSSLRTGLIGAAPSPVQLIEEIIERMGITGLVAGYGMTENSGGTALTQSGDPPEVIATTVGKPLPDVEIKIVDPETNQDLGREREGELCTRGYLIMKGYYRMPEETSKIMDDKGWFHTGDLGTITREGNLRITGRLKDMFISGGTNVSPSEIENFIYKHPKVKQVSVVGVPDERMGEVGMAFIILKNGEKSQPEEIIEFCKGKIANYKIPKYIEFLDELPLNAVGKVQKFKLREYGTKKIQST
ncbi:MAG: AMP-binding protein [Pseudomonadota bacterium]